MEDVFTRVSNAVPGGVEAKAMGRTYLEFSSNVDIDACSTQDESAGEATEATVDSTEDDAVDEEMSNVMPRTLADTLVVEESSGNQLGHPCECTFDRAQFIERSMHVLRSMAAREKKRIEEPHAEQQYFSQACNRVPQHFCDVGDSAAATISTRKTANTDGEQGAAFNGTLHPPGRCGVDVIHENIKRSPSRSCDDEDSIDDEVKSRDSGIHGPPSSRASAYDMGYANDVTLPQAYLKGIAKCRYAAAMACLLQTRELDARGCSQDARGHPSSEDGSRGLSQGYGARISL
eukprot:TRINITY_DN47601_c0_g1_i1.p1 TRINITY_DN47601_c0_g1~~TRINITY_DN47601_c0_g1_i1.p1  ORF type:complete len:310 (+),score=42.93 TRINITY_DN47601_c0_g1_i1:62-931(+)